jgi:hypothetical protein
MSHDEKTCVNCGEDRSGEASVCEECLGDGRVRVDGPGRGVIPCPKCRPSDDPPVVQINVPAVAPLLRGDHVHQCPECYEKVPCAEVCSLEYGLFAEGETPCGSYAVCDGCEAKKRSETAMGTCAHPPNDVHGYETEGDYIRWCSLCGSIQDDGKWVAPKRVGPTATTEPTCCEERNAGAPWHSENCPIRADEYVEPLDAGYVSALTAVRDNTCFVKVSCTLLNLRDRGLIVSCDEDADHRCGWRVTWAGNFILSQQGHRRERAIPGNSEADARYVEDLRKKAVDMRGAWEHGVLVRADLERKVKRMQNAITAFVGCQDYYLSVAYDDGAKSVPEDWRAVYRALQAAATDSSSDPKETT